MLCAYPFVLLFQTEWFDYKENYSALEKWSQKIIGMCVVINNHSLRLL